MSEKLPSEVYAVFCGAIDQAAVQRILNSLTTASSCEVQHLHLAFQSNGGMIGDGICLYNIFKRLPFGLTLYNTGAVSSVGVIAFLGAKERKASAHASFMIHRARNALVSANSELFESGAQSLRLDDNRLEAVWRENINLKRGKWVTARRPERHFTAQDALSIGLVGEIAEFSPPFGGRLYNI